MQRKTLSRYVMILALGLAAGCASDLWYKKGAGTAALAQDKAACRAEVAQLAGAGTSEAFEQCMSARDWIHVSRAGRRSAPARKAASATARTATTPAALAPTRATPVTPTVAALESTPAALEPEPVEEEVAEDEGVPEPIDPSSRQFWVKLGAGQTQLQADQKSCRRQLGIADTETEPSRWGQSEDFDVCMRSRGWGGGSIQAIPNR